MTHSFREVTIGELCTQGGGSVQTGPFGSQLKASAYVPVGIPTVMPADLIDFRVSETNIACIGPEDHARLKRHQLRPGDIVYGRRGDIGRHALVTERERGWLCGTGCLRIRFEDAVVEPRYVSYYLRQQSVIDLILSMAVGTTMPNLNTAILESVPLVLPPLPIQRRIAAILGRLDDKIELNRRINRMQEAMAQAIYKHWFVDFGPFQDGEFVESDMGLVPRGWKMKSLDEIATYTNGLALQRYPPTGDESLPVIKIAEMRRGTTESTDRASTSIDTRYIVEDGDVLFSWSGSLLVKLWCGGRGALNQHLFKVTSPRYPKWLYYWATQHHLEEFQRIAANKATTMGHIQRQHLSEALVAIPPETEFQRIHKIMSMLLDKIIECELESRQLAAIRDYLLPKLLSGEVEPTGVAMDGEADE